MDHVYDSSETIDCSAPSLQPLPSAHRLPAELWGHIGSCLASDGSDILSLTALRAVCRDSAAGLTPLVFHTVVFQDTAPSIERSKRVSATRDLGHLACHIRRARCEVKTTGSYSCATLVMGALWRAVKPWARLVEVDIILSDTPWKAVKAIEERVLSNYRRPYETRVYDTNHLGCIILQRPPLGGKVPKAEVCIAPAILQRLHIPAWILWEPSLTSLYLSNVVLNAFAFSGHSQLPYQLQHLHLSECYFLWSDIDTTWSLLWTQMLEDRVRKKWTMLRSVVVTRCGYVIDQAGVYTRLSIDDMSVETAEKDTEALNRLQAALD